MPTLFLRGVLGRPPRDSRCRQRRDQASQPSKRALAPRPPCPPGRQTLAPNALSFRDRTADTALLAGEKGA